MLLKRTRNLIVLFFSLKINSIVILLFMLLQANYLKAYSSKTDSLITVLGKLESDTIKLKTIIQLADILSDQNPDSAIYWLNEGLVLNNRLLDKSFFFNRKQKERLIARKGSIYNLTGYCYLGKAQYNLATENFQKAKHFLMSIADRRYLPTVIMNLGIIYKETGKLDSSLYYYHIADSLFKLSNNLTGIMQVKANLGVVKQKKGNYLGALNDYFDILALADKTENLRMKFISLNNIAMVYSLLNERQKTVNYLLQCSEVIKKEGSRSLLPVLYKNLSGIYFELGKEDSAKVYYNNALKLYTEFGDSLGIAQINFHYGLMMEKKYGIKEVLPIYYHALKVAEEKGDVFVQLRILENLTRFAVYKIEPGKTLYFIERALLLAKSYNSALHLKNLYMSYSKILEAKGENTKALKYYRIYSEISDSLLTESKQKDILELEKKYQTEKKQQQIELQNSQIKNQELSIQKAQLRTLYSILFAMVLIISGTIVFVLFSKRKTQQLKILKLNEELAVEQYQKLFQDSKLQAIKENIAGQEEERSRIARELHDGIGGTLAAVKMRLEAVDHQPNPEDMASLVNMVANTWEEVRTISHNLMPPQFEEVSVDRVLQNHIRELNKSNKIEFTIQFLPKIGWEKIPAELQVELYRVVQELCTNIIKYSNATNVEIQLSHFEGNINLIMEDDGAPFIYSSSGIGYRNLQERIKLFNGSFEKNEGNNKGNTYLVQIPFAHIKA